MNGNGATASLPATLTGAAPLRAVEDDALAHNAHGGDNHAFAELYERHHQALYRYCLSILRNTEDASDALQSTMLNALRSLRERDRDLAVKPWLFRIAHNESISLLRRRRPQVEFDEAAGELDLVVDQDAGTRARLQELVADLRDLSERQRGALVMRELSGLEYSEIGAALGITKGAAKQTVYEARVALTARAEGRNMDCDLIRRRLSDGDRRRVRGLKVRAHLHECRGCREFKDLLGTRRSALAALAPPLPVIASASLLHSLVGTASGGGSAAGGTTAGAGVLATTSAGAKSAAIVLALAAGGGAVVATGNAGFTARGAVSPQVKHVQTTRSVAARTFAPRHAVTSHGARAAARPHRAPAAMHRSTSGAGGATHAAGGSSASGHVTAAGGDQSSSSAPSTSGGSQRQDPVGSTGQVQSQVQSTVNSTVDKVESQLPPLPVKVPDVQVPSVPPVQVPSTSALPKLGS